MSRGHGSRQRTIIDALTAHAEQHPPMADFDTDGRLLFARYGFEHDHGLRDVPASFLTAAELTDTGTAAAIEATKRAIRTLRTAGIIETCHGRNRTLGARITPDEQIRDQWWLALDDHLHIEWLIDYRHNRLAEARAILRAARDEWKREQAQKSIDHNTAELAKSYRELRDTDTMLPSKQRARELERQSMTAEQRAERDRRAGEAMAELLASLGGAS